MPVAAALRCLHEVDASLRLIQHGNYGVARDGDLTELVVLPVDVQDAQQVGAVLKVNLLCDN